MKDTLIYVVAHNHREFLKDCLKSIFSQLDNETDVILIDSGSTDGSYEYLKNYSKEKKIHFYKKKLILTEIIDWVYIKFCSKYKYIMRVDADDCLSKNALKTLKDEISKDDNCGSVCGSWIEIDANSNMLNKMIMESGHANIAFHGACTLFRSMAIKNIRFKENDIFSQDGLYTWLKISDKWVCRTVSDFIFQYRRHEENLSNQENKLFDGRKSAYASIFKERKHHSNACVVIGFSDDLISDFDTNSFNEESLRKQIEIIEECDSINKVYISTSLNNLKSIKLNKFKKVSVINRDNDSKTLVESLQSCNNLKKFLSSHSDVLLLNPFKNIWKSNFIDISIYSKYVHSYKTVMACDFIKGSVFIETKGELEHVNFSNLNTAFTNNFLFIKLPGFLLIDSKNFYLLKDTYPKPIGHVSNNFLSLTSNPL